MAGESEFCSSVVYACRKLSRPFSLPRRRLQQWLQILFQHLAIRIERHVVQHKQRPWHFVGIPPVSAAFSGWGCPGNLDGKQLKMHSSAMHSIGRVLPPSTIHLIASRFCILATTQTKEGIFTQGQLLKFTTASLAVFVDNIDGIWTPCQLPKWKTTYESHGVSGSQPAR